MATKWRSMAGYSRSAALRPEQFILNLRSTRIMFPGVNLIIIIIVDLFGVHSSLWKCGVAMISNVWVASICWSAFIEEGHGSANNSVISWAVVWSPTVKAQMWWKVADCSMCMPLRLGMSDPRSSCSRPTVRPAPVGPDRSFRRDSISVTRWSSVARCGDAGFFRLLIFLDDKPTKFTYWLIGI